MMATHPEGFNFDIMNNNSTRNINNNNNMNGCDDVVIVDDDDEFAIDADDLLRMLDEDDDVIFDGDHHHDDTSFTPQFPATSFYASTDNTQEKGSAILADDQMGAVIPSDYGAASENSMETVEALEQLPFASLPNVALNEADNTSFGKKTAEASAYQVSNLDQSQCFPLAQDWGTIYNFSSGFPDHNFFNGVNCDLMSTNEAIRGNMKHDLDDLQPSHSWLDTKIGLESQVGAAYIIAPEVCTYDFFDGRGSELITDGSNPLENVQVVSALDNSSGSTTTDETSAEPCHWRLMGKSPMTTVEQKVEKNGEIFLLNGLKSRSSEAVNGFALGSDARKLLGSTKTQYSGFIGSHPTNFPAGGLTNMQWLGNSLSPADLFAEFGSSCYKTEYAEGQPAISNPPVLKGSLEASQSCLSEGQSEIDDSNDLCIIEDMSGPARAHPIPFHGKPAIPHPAPFTPQCSTSITPFHHVGSSGTRMRGSDERLIFQSLVQDLSQPKIEAYPPDGALAVPLLRHQRIALSWMVQKETKNVHCSGGILADDQGLGKTVSTIALILSERPTFAKTLKEKEQDEPEMLDLDEEDDTQAENKTTSSVVKGRPSAGTLIVCPTSVLRQWAEELGNKVTSKGNLSVYVYHGSNRTKDPFELSKYDVVLTTYSIVSMEVPKQPNFRKGGKDGRKSDLEDDPVQLTRKRKHSSTSDKRRSKKGVDNELVESVAHPLAKVGWFRVVLDEAQSIKNHRTRVAQACWGLRAKRRWCLSGTPIQNAIDDLYSYFRFLKYDPYDVYNSFCSMVKNPIQKNPTRGYHKLQAVLKNIMLRRTKGTLLDGLPIINLPPKSVKLKKVEFSEEERNFYNRLEADSRAQFQAYADSGTVKQNYVNILLMLLRLRQACDHPFLVHGYDCSSVLKSSIQTAKKLPQEKQIALLSCLEASLALCGICRDPPEDAVVSICGHVFCNQCISERFTGDDNQCPAKNCKSEISSCNVFSKGTLKSCLSDQVCQDGSHISGFPDQKELIEPQPASQFESSKIKAALEVLCSLSRPHASLDINVCKQSNPSDKSDTVTCGADNENSGATKGSGNTNCVVKEKAIVFSQWTRMLDLLENCLKESSIQYRRLDGTMSVVARDKAVRDFNTLPEVSVMIMSLKAASLGLNMVAACHVLLLDLWWNPTTEDQAIDRAHRIGQTRPVTVVRLTVKDTVEDRILALQQKKRELVASAFGEDEKGSRQSRLTVEDLAYLFMA